VTTPVPVYLGGPSSNLPRVKAFAAKLDEADGVRITCRWWQSFDRYQSDYDVPPVEAQRIAAANLDGVAEARIVWLMWPGTHGGSVGVPIELGFALAWQAREIGASAVVLSGGDTRASLFTSLADLVFADDASALAAVLRLAREARQ